ncbi:phosphatidylserine/phosphatidylglycerophosphate/cardiolipin synthase-like enzyme [Azomonas agilis]|uniref:Phosphatidylserine/phosphatidylglycerophosphate/ cardiolipin synthase-like enzyme n=1 Tax=Azomonas agilis TaxID=116849 RepID=A0A562I2T8_9GAMM|nr:phosphatidylserine/phosphatidylglycerophosphate/cardiolipin synthase family protein [Azomonas agilis]TWH64963.1 phosphatidylserine/phosphatidylglycerophosphate/cardiolipin synthase-like enzyme [Azomonas agilis]
MGTAGPIFPWREGNDFELLIDGDVFMPRMLEAIRQARIQVDLEFYLVESGQCAEQLIETLIRLSQRGVQVRCLFDAFGSLGLGQAQRDRLTQAGVLLRFYNPLALRRYLRNFHRDHRKILLIDGRSGFVGGTGITDEFWNKRHPEQSWHEVMVQMRGPIVNDWQVLFEHQWRHHKRWMTWPFPIPLRVRRIPATPLGNERMGRVAYAASHRHRDILHNLLRHLQRAKGRIYLATPYFLPSWKVRRALVRAARRGVDVRLLLSGQHTDHPQVRYAGQRHYSRLLRAGVRIYEYQPRFVHLKMALVDDWVTLGSCNFDHWNLRWNLEANLEVMDPQLNAAVRACFEEDFAQSREIDLNQWQARPWFWRLTQYIWGYFDRLLIKLSDRRSQ